MTADRGFAGTGMSFSELNALPDARRNTILAYAWSALTAEIEPLIDARKEAEKWLADYAFQNNSRLFPVDDELEVVATPKVKWEYDIEGLDQLTNFGVSQAEYEQAVQPTFKVNKDVLNDLKKRGGNIAEIIDQNCIDRGVGRDIKVRQRKTKTPKATPKVFSRVEDAA